MSWVALSGNQVVTWANLQDAVDNNVFIKIGAIPPAGVSANKAVTKLGALTAVDIQSAPLAGKADNQLVVKNDLVASVKTYYKLTACGGGADAWTSINPSLGYGQRYILPSSTPTYYYYSGVTQNTLPAGYNGSIQLVAGATYCP